MRANEGDQATGCVLSISLLSANQPCQRPVPQECIRVARSGMTPSTTLASGANLRNHCHYGITSVQNPSRMSYSKLLLLLLGAPSVQAHQPDHCWRWCRTQSLPF